jgi:hypothetical protein
MIFFTQSRGDRTECRTNLHDGSTTLFDVRMCPFGVSLKCLRITGWRIPKTPIFSASMAIWNQHKNFEQLLNEKRKTKLSRGHFNKNGVEKGNSDVTSDLLRPIITATTSGRNLKNRKILKNAQRVAQRRVHDEDTKEPPYGLSNNDNYAVRRRHLLPISVSGLLLRHEKVLITRKRWELDEECLQNTNTKPISAYQMFRLLPLRAPPFNNFRSRSVFSSSKSVLNLKTARVGREMPT